MTSLGLARPVATGDGGLVVTSNRSQDVAPDFFASVKILISLEGSAIVMDSSDPPPLNLHSTVDGVPVGGVPVDEPNSMVNPAISKSMWSMVTPVCDERSCLSSGGGKVVVEKWWWKSGGKVPQSIDEATGLACCLGVRVRRFAQTGAARAACRGRGAGTSARGPFTLSGWAPGRRRGAKPFPQPTAARRALISPHRCVEGALCARGRPRPRGEGPESEGVFRYPR